MNNCDIPQNPDSLTFFGSPATLVSLVKEVCASVPPDCKILLSVFEKRLDCTVFPSDSKVVN